MQKSKAIALTFRPFLADFSIYEKEAKNGKRVRLYGLTFCPFLADFSIFEKEAKNKAKTFRPRLFSLAKK